MLINFYLLHLLPNYNVYQLNITTNKQYSTHIFLNKSIKKKKNNNNDNNKINVIILITITYINKLKNKHINIHHYHLLVHQKDHSKSRIACFP